MEQLSREASHYLLSIPSGKSDQYRLAQLDDYAQLRRSDFPLERPVSLSLSARASSNSIPGTWGFGFWNDPFGLSLGFGGNAFRLPALPNAVWFFGASEESYLSFREIRAERNEVEAKRALQTKSPFQDLNLTSNRAPRHRPPGRVSTTPPTSGGSAHYSPDAFRERGGFNGFLVQSFRSPRFHPSLILAGMALPFSRKTTRRLLGKIIDEDGIRLSVDVTQWHRYRLDWREERVSFEADETLVFESPVSPETPLGLVIWIDNQYAAFTPEGKIGFGVLENPEPAWLEVKDVNVT